MKLPSRDVPFRILTPCFCGGANQDAELRVPSIRGQIRQWHEELFGLTSMERVWGAAGNHPTASQISLLAVPRGSAFVTDWCRTLPHCDEHSSNKQEKGKAQTTREAILPGEFTLSMSWLPARPALQPGRAHDQDWVEAQKAVRIWLLLGALGLRASRAAGSVWPAENAPASAAVLAEELAVLQFKGVAWLGTPQAPLTGKNLDARCEALRTAASDTPDGHPDVFGAIEPERIPSPVRFKVVSFADQPMLLMMGRDKALLDRAKNLLSSHRAGNFTWNSLYTPLCPA